MFNTHSTGSCSSSTDSIYLLSSSVLPSLAFATAPLEQPRILPIYSREEEYDDDDGGGGGREWMITPHALTGGLDGG